MLSRNSLDEDGQPLILSFNARRRIDAGIDELLGLIRGITADGEVSTREADALLYWCARHEEIVNDWPVSVLIRRLERIYADGVVEDEEREELRLLLSDIIGEKDAPLTAPVTSLPLCRPVPAVVFEAKTFVLTGQFALGPRRVCESQVIERGGFCSGSVTKKIDYLVIGSVGSRDWIHSSWGRKIEQAVEYRDRPRSSIRIISEQSWAAVL